MAGVSCKDTLFMPAADLEVDFSFRRTLFGEEILNAVAWFIRFVVRVILACR
jgi:hypothetical protein